MNKALGVVALLGLGYLGYNYIQGADTGSGNQDIMTIGSGKVVGNPLTQVPIGNTEKAPIVYNIKIPEAKIPTNIFSSPINETKKTHSSGTSLSALSKYAYENVAGVKEGKVNAVTTKKGIDFIDVKTGKTIGRYDTEKQMSYAIPTKAESKKKKEKEQKIDFDNLFNVGL